MENELTTAATGRREVMSYKFQRLREKLRHAIASGELTGKLPGERLLARRFRVNAKTLSKALTDLAAEGVLDRSIGRGTYVKGSAPTANASGRWLILCDEAESNGALVAHFRNSNGESQVATSVEEMRPSFLNGFQAVIDMASNTPESFLRGLVVRNIPIVAVGREARTYSTHTVLPDVVLGVSRLGRDLLLTGHRKFAVIEAANNTQLSQAIRRVAAQFSADAIVDSSSATDVAAMINSGVTAVICGSPGSAATVKQTLKHRQIDVPASVSLAAVGCVCGEAPCSGYFVDGAQVAEAAVELLRNTPARPSTLWLAGKYFDRGTVAPSTAPPSEASSLPRFGGVLV